MRSNGFVLVRFLFVVSQSRGVSVHRLALMEPPPAVLRPWLATMDVRVLCPFRLLNEGSRRCSR